MAFRALLPKDIKSQPDVELSHGDMKSYNFVDSKASPQHVLQIEHTLVYASVALWCLPACHCREEIGLEIDFPEAQSKSFIYSKVHNHLFATPSPLCLMFSPP